MAAAAAKLNETQGYDVDNVNLKPLQNSDFDKIIKDYIAAMKIKQAKNPHSDKENKEYRNRQFKRDSSAMAIQGKNKAFFDSPEGKKWLASWGEGSSGGGDKWTLKNVGSREIIICIDGSCPSTRISAGSTDKIGCNSSIYYGSSNGSNAKKGSIIRKSGEGCGDTIEIR